MTVWKRVASGRYINLSAFSVADVDLEDILVSLSNMARFDGHSALCPPLSVLQHSILVHDLQAGIDPHLCHDALIHDCHEAYIGDVASPTKQLTGYVEPAHIAAVVRTALDGDPDACVKAADILALDIERRSMWDSEPGDEKYWPTPCTTMTDGKARAIFDEYRFMGRDDFMRRFDAR